LRLPVPILAAAVLAGCGSSAPEPAEGNGQRSGEVSIKLPPPLPAEASPKQRAPARKPVDATPPKAAVDVPIPQAGEPRLVAASPPIAAGSLAGYIRGAGFQCDNVVSTTRVAGGPYKFDCAAGGSYRGTMKQNHLYFRPWTGR
jgi:hypothetical protein